MRNLKRALSLALASIMLLGMMVVGSSAAGIDDFSDKADIVNQDAVAVTAAIGLFAGYEDGSFGPENVVTRAEMAVIICNMLYGAGVNVNQFTETKVFTDVPAWAEGYVNLCNQLGIVAGVGDGKFDPNATVTTAQAVLMLCRTLGYFQSSSDFGSDWMLAATAKGTQLGLYGDLKLSATAGLSRDNVAELVFNTLTKAIPVQYNSLLGVYYNENQGVVAQLKFDYLETLGYKNFDLVYRTGDEAEYGRPATTWGTGSYMTNYGLDEDGGLLPRGVRMLATNEVITVADAPDYVYTKSTSNKNIYKDIGEGIIKEFDWTAYVNGVEEDATLPVKSSSSRYAYTNDGTVTEVYIDSTVGVETVKVISFDYYLAEVSRVRTDDDGEYAVVRVDEFRGTLDNKVYCEGFAEDDYVVVTMDYDADEKEYFVASIADPDTADGIVKQVRRWTEFESGETNGNYLVMDDDTKYTYSNWTSGDLEDDNTPHPTLDTAYMLYLDPNGFVIGFIATEDVSSNYLYVVDSDVYMSTAEAKVVLADGTGKTIKLDDDLITWTLSGGTWSSGKDDLTGRKGDGNAEADNHGLAGEVFAYTVDDDVYTLIQIPNAKNNTANQSTASLIKNGVAYLTANGISFIVDKNTVFVDVDGKVIYTGYENVPNFDNAKFWIVDRKADSVANVVFVYDGDKYDENATWFYVKSATDFVSYNKDKTVAIQYCYVDGEKTEVLINYGERNSVIGNTKGLYKVLKTNDDGVATDIEYVGDTNAKIPNITALPSTGLKTYTASAASGSAFWTNQNDDYGVIDRKSQWIVDNDTLYVVVDKDNNVRTGSFKDIKTNSNLEVGDIFTYVTVIKTANEGKTARLIYIVEEEFLGTQYTVTPTFDGAQADVKLNNTAATSGTSVKYLKDAKVTIEVAAKTGFEISKVEVNGSTVTLTDGKYVINALTANTTVVVTTAVEGANKVTLSLSGDLANARVWTGDGKTLLSPTATTAYGASYTVDKGTELLVVDSDLPAAGNVLDGNMDLVGTATTVNGANALKLKMTEDMALTEADVVELLAIHVGNDVTLKGIFKANGTTAVTPVAEKDGIYYVSKADNTQKFTVQTTDANAAIVVVKDGVKVGRADSQKATGTKGADQVLDFGSAISSDVYLYAASQVRFPATVGVKANGVALAAQDYVKVGANLVSAVTTPASNGTGVIAGPNDTVEFGADVSSGYVLKNDTVYLYGAFKITLNGVDAEVSTGDLTDGIFVRKGKSISAATATTGAGTEVIDTTAGNLFAASVYSPAAVNGDLVLSAAVKLDVETNSKIKSVTYVSQPSGLPVDVTAGGTKNAYVIPDTVVDITAKANAVVVEDAGVAIAVDSRDDTASWARLTVGTKDLTLKDNT